MWLENCSRRPWLLLVHGIPQFALYIQIKTCGQCEPCEVTNMKKMVHCTTMQFLGYTFTTCALEADALLRFRSLNLGLAKWRQYASKTRVSRLAVHGKKRAIKCIQCMIHDLINQVRVGARKYVCCWCGRAGFMQFSANEVFRPQIRLYCNLIFERQQRSRGAAGLLSRLMSGGRPRVEYGGTCVESCIDCAEGLKRTS